MAIHNKPRLLLLSAFVASLILSIGVSVYWSLNKGEQAIVQPVDKILRFSYTLTNSSADFIPRTEFYSYLPLIIPGKQVVGSISSSHNYEVIEGDGSQPSIKFVLKDFPPYGSKIVSLTIEVQVSALPQRDDIKETVYLKAEKYIEADSSVVQNLAKSFEASPEKAAYQWLANNIKDAGYVAENKGARFALEQRSGDCTEHMYAFVALARARGIPARGVAGFVLEKPAEILTSSSYHNWAEYYDGEKWILVDSQRRLFNSAYQNYIPFRVFGGESELSTSANRFLTTDPRIFINL